MNEEEDVCNDFVWGITLMRRSTQSSISVALPKSLNSELNYVRGEPDKTPGRASPAVRAHYKPENEDGRAQPRLISPAAFEPQPQYTVQVSPNDFALHSTIVHE